MKVKDIMTMLENALNELGKLDPDLEPKNTASAQAQAQGQGYNLKGGRYYRVTDPGIDPVEIYARLNAKVHDNLYATRPPIMPPR